MKPTRNPSQSLFIGLVISLLLTIASAGIVLAAGTAVLPDYRKPVLLPSSQTNAWTNVVPNALADYFTYVPFTTADAVKLGFPSSCGRLPGDAASTEDCYTITVKKFQQQLALPGIFGGGSGLIDPATGFPFAPASYPWVYGYGSGGAGWLLPYYDTAKAGVVANTPVTGNAPAPFTDGTFSASGIWHFPAPTIKGTQGRPVRVQWLNELPNEKPTGFDPTVCDGAPADCFPYNRIVTHVHGAHVGPESDGLAQAWFSPNFADKGIFWESTRQHGPEGTYFYPMDQEASTIWYHDHAVGLTHNNTNMGMAGFFPITDTNEKRLQGIGGPKYLPTGAQELGFALQDRIFYNDGQLAMPDAPVIDAAYTTCAYTIDPVSGDITPTVAANCAPLFMKDPLDGHLIPYINNGTNVPLLATSATLEFFGNMPVVNGVTYGKYNVDKGVYRMRFIGGTDSRAWALRLKVAASNPARYLPFWVIGTEQGLLNNPVKREHMLIMPGERYDVLVDFNSAETVLSDGVTSAGPMDLANQRVIVENWAGDGPYGGEVILPANDPLAVSFRSVDIPEVMVFDVSATALATADVPTPSTGLALRPANIQPLVADAPTRTVSLVEIVDNFGRIMPTIDARGFMEFPVTELPQLGKTEQWDIVNTTVDAHPMHLHQVAFQLINREDINVLGLDPVTGDPILDVVPAQIVAPYNPASYNVTTPAGSTLIPAASHEAGWKDTVMCPPGKVTRVIAKYDIPGAYVWHCHILSHEEHDMMRPLVVTTPATSVTLDASGVSQPSNATMTPVTLTAQAFTGIAAYPVGSGFEYEFVVTQGATVIPEQPTRVAPKFLSSTADGFNMVRIASWTPPSTPGTYTITVSTKAMGPTGPGNPLQTAFVTYTVANATVSIDPATLTATYDGAPKPVTIQPTTPAGLTVDITYNGSATPPTNAGSYTVVATINDGTNTYYGSTSATLVINRANATVTANNQIKTYGSLLTFVGNEFTTLGFIAPDAVTSVTLTSIGDSASAPVTTYTIIPTSAVGIGLANYNITYVSGVLTVTATASTASPPDYRKPVLLPSSQTNAWTNVVPNALADYFTYVPFTTADAVKLGFPSSCGRLPGDAASTEDCYTITVKKFQQQLALPGIFGGGSGLIDPASGFPFAPANYPWVYGYGSGGAGWLLPYYDTTKAGVVANTPVTGNAPAPFTDGTFSASGIWHFPAPTIKGTQGRPVRVQWLNELPNEKPTGFDPTVCDGAPFDCFPYNRIVTHVHGAHVGPESDGMVHSWFTPGFAEKGPLWESTRQFGPEGTYFYPMDQEAATIWYHDHSTGLTHNNTNMGMAGFFPITDANEKRLQGIGGPKYLPTGAQELGFALQDRIFYNDGQLAMPDAPIIDAAATTCAYTIDPVSGDITPTVAANCAPLFMKDALDGHLIPYVNNGVNVPLLATSATLEFFGNMPVVNGVTYGKYNVDKGVYRMRFIGGTDSRAWALRLKVAASNPARYLPFWVIGTEQGLLNNPAKSESLLIMPGERYDVLVDFNSAETLLSDGTTSAGPMDLANQRVIVENWAGDGPYGGEVILPANDPLAAAFRSVDIPEVMAFDVSATALGAADVPAPTTTLALRPANIQPLVADAPTRTVSLVEIVDNFGRIMPTIDARGFMEFPVTELPQLGATEQWDIVNTTVDAHPMHLHQVAFQLINREDINVLGLDPVTGDPILDVVPAQIVPPYNPASYTVSQPANSTLTPAASHEAGWKDTVMCPPGKVTRVIAKYDIPGVYVWHCHILSHEEHDMMRPLVVTTPATSVTLDASGVSQPSNATMTPVTLTAQAFTGIAAYPVGSGFEYEFVATQGATVIPEQPTRIASKILSSTVDGFNMIRSASWTPPSTPGTYTITVSAKAMGPTGPGNPLQTASVSYTVANATQTITFTPPTTATFGDAPILLSATGGASGNPVTFAVTSGPGNITGGNTLNITGVGTIVVTASQAGNATYSAAADVPVSILVSPRPVTIAANNTTRPYGAVNPPNPGYSITSGTLATGDSIASVSYTYQNSATATAFAGTTHSITPGTAVFSTGSAGNYAITYVNGLLRITRAPLTITINNQTKTYGTAFTFNGSEFTTTGLLNTDQVNYVAMTSNGAPGYATVSGSPYPIVPSTAFGTGLGNYNISYVNGAMTVIKATPVITWGTPAPITFGTPLSSTQLNATANVSGSLTYSPAAGTVLNTSSATLSVTFTPTNTANYTTATAAVTQITVAGATSVAKIGAAPPYSSIQAAYNAAVNNDVIEVIGTNVPGNFTANKSLTTVTIKGGYSSSFTPIPANTTTIQGTVTLQQGTVIMDGIVVK